MQLSSHAETGAARDSNAGRTPQRAGLRIAPPSHEPTGVFVVIEMAVLVLVTALAMVAVIVSTGESDRADPTAQSSAPSEARTRRAPDDAIGMPRTKADDARRANASVLSR